MGSAAIKRGHVLASAKPHSFDTELRKHFTSTDSSLWIGVSAYQMSHFWALTSKLTASAQSRKEHL